MRTHHFFMGSLAVLLFGVTSLGSSQVWATGFDFFKKDDQSVCYQAFQGDLPMSQVFRINVKKHSPLTTHKEKYKLGHPLQTTYSIVGKKLSPSGVCCAADENVIPNPDHYQMASASGSAVKADKNGARLALIITDLLSLNTVPVFRSAGSIEFLECASKESSATPKVWELCSSVNLFLVDQKIDRPNDLNLNLRRVDPLKQHLCSFFNAFPTQNDRQTIEE